MESDEDDEDDEEEGEEEEEAEDVEEEEDEQVKKQKEKKKVAEEEGVPEDEVEDGNDDELDEEEDEEDDEDEDDAIGDAEEEVEEKITAPKQKAVKKKKAVKPSYTANTTALTKQYQLQSRAGFKELETVEPIDKTVGKEKDIRTHILTCIQTQFGRLFKKSDQFILEQAILKSSFKDASQKKVLKHFDNPLFESLYLASARRLLGNLNTKSYVGNQQLLQKVLQGTLSIDTLADMTAMDYAPQIYAPLRERMNLREQHQLEGNKAMATDLFKCGRCHKRECTYYELQTRSADEPMTKFITCLNCGNHWRM